MKTYTKPELELFNLSTEEVLLISNTDTPPGGNEDYEDGKTPLPEIPMG